MEKGVNKSVFIVLLGIYSRTFLANYIGDRDNIVKILEKI
jgi:hypothetical protein